MTGIELHKLGYTDIHALDISQEMLNIAKQKGVPYKRFVCTPLTEQSIKEFATGEFDALIAAGVLVKAHVRPAAFVEIIRMVKAGKTGLRYGKTGNKIVQFDGKNAAKRLEKRCCMSYYPLSIPSTKTSCKLSEYCLLIGYN